MAVPMPSHAEEIYIASRPATTQAAWNVNVAYRLLHFGFIVAPIVAGLDKFLHWMVNWNIYLAPIVPQTLGVTADQFMMAVGGIEIAAGLLVAWKPRIFACVVGLWLWGIIANLLMHANGYYDIALRDFGLSLGAFALAALARDFDRPRKMIRISHAGQP